ncbi:uncharacterized protein JN550_003242 [Neoarthrinium moseri]|uniref:uncharacterized protein n=1 Tax=Neoarthrinium moseri TaxID=1658444 RepID=UPI001FDC832C|nr:uncharacterized protein JN550_003242 [Neoarthrinium moseri]KAI1873973.1 hypothetical protein JN550_003242 [Neoarthrinium moseri]
MEQGHPKQADASSPKPNRSQRCKWRNGQYSDKGGRSWTSSTLGKQSTSSKHHQLAELSLLPEWHQPEPELELEARCLHDLSTSEGLLHTPPWHYPESGLEVVQPDTAEKILVTPRRRLWGVFAKDRICGLRRRLFWLILCAILLVIGIVLGLALGLTLRGTAGSSSTSSPTAGTPTMDPSSTPSPTLTGMPACPDADGTTYTDPTSNIEFVMECGVTHDGSDISHHVAYSMDDCVASCAQSSICMGAVWISAGKQGTDNNFCWLHSDMSQEQFVRVNAYAQSATRKMG